MLNFTNVKQRQSNFELLRILAMIMIVAHHYVVHGSLQFDSLTLNSFLLRFISIGGKIGVDIFVLISGYFLVNSKMKGIKVLKLFLQVWFWGIATLLFFGIYLFSIHFIDFREFIKKFIQSVFFIKSSYWFVKPYIFLYILHPFINIVIKSINKEQFLKLIIFLLFIYCIWPKIEFSSVDSLNWFITLYLLSAYTKLYCVNIFKDTKKLFFVAILLYIVVFISATLIGLVGLKNPLIASKSMVLASMESPFILIISFCIFAAFINIKFYNNTVNKIASATFGVYLIHDNAISRIFFWKYLLNNEKYANSNFLILHIVVSVAFVYILCTILELLRKKYIEPFYMIFFEKNKEIYSKIINNVMSTLKKIK